MVNRNKESFSFTIHVHQEGGFSSAPHHIHSGPNAKGAVTMWDIACIIAERKENKALTASAQF